MSDPAERQEAFTYVEETLDQLTQRCQEAKDSARASHAAAQRRRRATRSKTRAAP